MLDSQDKDEVLLLAQACAGDAHAFGQLYENHAQVIFRYLFAHVNDRLDAEDMTEEVFLRAWRSLPNFQDQGVPFVAYLFRVARNALIDYYRQSRKNEPELSLDDDFGRDLAPASTDLATDGVERREIHHLLNQLREDYRTVLTLRFISGLSPEETANSMGKSTGAVRVLQHRALAALRKLMVDP